MFKIDFLIPHYLFFLPASVDVTDAIVFTAVEQLPIFLSCFLTRDSVFYTQGNTLKFSFIMEYLHFMKFGNCFNLIVDDFSFLGMLQTVENPITLEKTDQG